MHDLQNAEAEAAMLNGRSKTSKDSRKGRPCMFESCVTEAQDLSFAFRVRVRVRVCVSGVGRDLGRRQAGGQRPEKRSRR